jgi:hypothetical protein
VHTLALPTRPVKQARALAYGLALACTTLTPLPSHAFTYDTQAGPMVIQHQSTGTKRATTSFTLVGTSADFTLSILIRRV